MFGIEKRREECPSLPLVQVRAPFVLDRLVLSRLKDPRYTSNSRGVEVLTGPQNLGKSPACSLNPDGGQPLKYMCHLSLDAPLKGPCRAR